MNIEIQLTNEPIPVAISPPLAGSTGAWMEFRGVVRGEEKGESIAALEYEAYLEMAEREIHRLLGDISRRHTCLAAKVIHRVGIIPVGDTAIYVGVAAAHRAEAIALLAEFMDRLKQDVPIWKRRALPLPTANTNESILFEKSVTASRRSLTARSLDEAIQEIRSRCVTLPGVQVSLEQAVGRILCESVCAPEDSPTCDRSTRDGYAVLLNDDSELFHVVDALHAADWKPRQLNRGEAVRVATGSAMPCEHLRVIMQEDVERSGDKIKILERETAANVRRRGEEIHKGEIVLKAGQKLDAGALALLASMGCTQPKVSPVLKVAHFTTGDEIVPPEQTPGPGQIRDSNSILVCSLLESFSCKVIQRHLPENFAGAQQAIDAFGLRLTDFDMVLVSGGASVGEKDFTGALLESLGFEIVFNRLNLRPGAPLIFGVDGARVAFGLPGNPLSHMVCFHALVAEALAKMFGDFPRGYLRGSLAEALEDLASPRETLWPARLTLADGQLQLVPLPWRSSGDVAVLAEASALVRVPANQREMRKGSVVDFLPIRF